MSCNLDIGLDEYDYNNCNDECSNSDIIINCKSILIPNNQKIIAVQNENNVKIKNFIIKKKIDSIDISTKNFFIYIINSNGETFSNSLSVTEKDSEHLILTWNIKNDITKIAGDIDVQIVITSDNYEWRTFKSKFKISESILL